MIAKDNNKPETLTVKVGTLRKDAAFVELVRAIQNRDRPIIDRLSA